VSEIADVYKTLALNSVPVVNQSPFKRGATVYAETAITASAEDEHSTMVEPEILPIVIGVKIRVPLNAVIEEEAIGGLIDATLALLKDDSGHYQILSKAARGITNTKEY
jgi:hypothetical protein